MKMHMLMASWLARAASALKDQSSAVAPDAVATATNSKTNVARSKATNAAGIYSFPDLTLGTCEVKMAAGFASIVTTNIELGRFRPFSRSTCYHRSSCGEASTGAACTGREQGDQNDYGQ